MYTRRSGRNFDLPRGKKNLVNFHLVKEQNISDRIELVHNLLLQFQIGCCTSYATPFCLKNFNHGTSIGLAGIHISTVNSFKKIADKDDLLHKPEACFRY